MPIKINQDCPSLNDRPSLPYFEAALWIATDEQGGTHVACDSNPLETATYLEHPGCSIVPALRKKLA
jgi:hypothetical protein